MVKLVNTDRWSDDCFRRLTAYSKILLVYLCDSCDEAGFVKNDIAQISCGSSIQASHVAWALNELTDNGYVVFSEDGSSIWLARYLDSQFRTPLNVLSKSDSPIYYTLKLRLGEFGGNEAMASVIDGAVSYQAKDSGNSQRNGGGQSVTPPTIEEMQSFAIKMNPKRTEWAFDNAKVAWHHYNAVGWKIAGCDIVDWRSCLLAWFGKSELMDKRTEDGIRVREDVRRAIRDEKDKKGENDRLDAFAAASRNLMEIDAKILFGSDD